MTLKNGFGKFSLFVLSANGMFYQPMKYQTWTLRFPANEIPNMEEALFDWPIVLQYDVKGKYRLVSRKFWPKEVVSAEHSLNHPKATYARFYPLDKLLKSLFLRSFAVSVLFARFFISRSCKNCCHDAKTRFTIDHTNYINFMNP